jgi:hypothetical protein
MNRIRHLAPVAAALVLVSSAAFAQDESRAVAGGGISAPGWQGQVDPTEASKGAKLTDAKLAKMGNGVHVTTGPAMTYWHPDNKASGNYTVKATFTEAKYMSLNNHPHPYGIVIGGNAMETPNASYLYCAAYGNGTFIVRGFGPAAFKVNGARSEPNAAIKKAAGKDSSVTQEIAVSVKGDKVECAINGTVVGSYDKAAVIGDGKLKSTDGMYGIRVGHNADVHVSGLTVTKQ